MRLRTRGGETFREALGRQRSASRNRSGSTPDHSIAEMRCEFIPPLLTSRGECFRKLETLNLSTL